MAPPAAHHVEEMAAGGQGLRVETAERGDGAVVDVDDAARLAIELRVWRLVVPVVGRRREQAVAANRIDYEASRVRSAMTPAPVRSAPSAAMTTTSGRAAPSNTGARPTATTVSANAATAPAPAISSQRRS
jgi:hypothetical protein